MSKTCDFLKNVRSRVGNNVSHSNAKTKRMFHLNLQTLSLYSNILIKSFNIKTTTRTIRTIYNKYEGSFDKFLIGTNANNLTDWALIQRRRIKKIIKKQNLSAL